MRAKFPEDGDDRKDTTVTSRLVDILLARDPTKFHMLCDHSKIKDLTPEQVAAMYCFIHEVLASLYRLHEKVPEEVINEIISGKIHRAVTGIEP